MTTGELTTIYTAGFGLLAVILFFIVVSHKANDARPMAKVRVRVDDRRRALPHPEENDMVQQPDHILVGLLMILASLVAIVVAVSWSSS